MGGENNQVLWRGVRPVEGISGIWPARNSLRYSAEGVRTGEGEIELCTIDSVSKLFISSAFLASRESVAAPAVVTLFVRDSADVVVCVIMRHFYDIAGQLATPIKFSPALEALPGYDVVLSNDHANVDSVAEIFGWMEGA